MRRWNGWGDDTVDVELPESAATFLAELVGEGQPQRDAFLEDVASRVPPSRLPAFNGILTDPEERVRHACGQSFPDWVAIRYGRIPAYPDGVAYPQTEADVGDLLQYAQTHHIHLIPYGGGTSVVGHINPLAGSAPVLTVDMSRLKRLQFLDAQSHLATFGAGVSGPELEATLRAHGFTLGHFPQSFEYSTLGGWVVTRSSGQQSLRYGRIENLFAGGKLVSPIGVLELPAYYPASAAGPDLRQLVLGSEGRMGILTEATVRISPLPEREDFHAVFFPDFESGMTAVREIRQAAIPVSMLRLSTAVETQTTLALAGHERLIGFMEQLLALRSIGDRKCMLIFGLTGNTSLLRAARSEVLSITGRMGGIHVGKTFGQQWYNGRFRTPYLRNALWDAGYAADTLETATDWSRIPSMIAAIETALRGAMAPFNEKIHVFTHLSHVYAHGSSVYTTYLFRLADDPEENLARWRKLKAAASEAIVAQNGTISHQHGVGLDHLPYLVAEKRELGLQTIRTLMNQFDPQGLMNPGKLI